MLSDRVAVFIPSLRDILAESERKAGQQLTEADVISIKNHAVYMLLPREEAEQFIALRGFDDLDPSNLWEEWCAIRAGLGSSTPAVSRPPRGMAILPDDPKRRHEELINLFGRHLFVLRNRTMQRLAHNVEATQEQRNALGKLHRLEYDGVAALDRDARQASMRLARKAVDSFLREILVLFTHNGASIEMAIDDQHSVAYDVVLRILSRETLESVEEHTVNRDGEKVPFDYFGRWLNKYNDCTELNP